MDKKTIIILVCTVIILVSSVALFVISNKDEKNKITDSSVNNISLPDDLNTYDYYNKKNNFVLAIDYSTPETLIVHTSFLPVKVEEDGKDIISVISSNKIEYLNVYSLDENLVEQTALKAESNIAKGTQVNIRANLSETIPNMQFKIKVEGDTERTFIPIYNGKDGSYIFEERKQAVD